jgi:nitroreductase
VRWAADAPERAPLLEAVRAALELAQRAPSSFNLQPYRAVVVADELARTLTRPCRCC